MISNEKVELLKKQVFETGIFPALYTKTVRGSRVKTRIWQLNLAENDDGTWKIYSITGDKGGKMRQNKPRIIKKGKNIGKKNETTVEEQAFSRAWSIFEKELKKRRLSEVDAHKSPAFYPMLAVKFQDRKSAIMYPAAIQRKLDGTRCIICMKDGEVRMFSRQMKERGALFSRIRREFAEKIYPQLPENRRDIHFFDGEIYSKNMLLQTITKVFNTVDPSALPLTELAEKREIAEKVDFWMFDCGAFDRLAGSDSPATFRQRHGVLQRIADNLPTGSPVRLVETLIANSEADVDNYLTEFVKNGYEGVMIRNLNGPYMPSKYTSGRSKDLQKYKPKDDDDLLIVDITEAEGPEESEEFNILIKVRIDNEKQTILPVTGCGSKEYQRQVLADKDQYIGAYLRIHYHGLTKDGIPRHAVPARAIIAGKKIDKYIVNYGK